MQCYLVMILLLVAAAVGGIWLAYAPVMRQSKSNIVYYGEGFSAGVFLGASLLHMLPDAVSDLQSVASAWQYPVASLLCALGFLLLYAIERIAKQAFDQCNQCRDPHLTPSGLTYLLVLILSIHSVIVGISLGMEPSSLAALVIMLALLVHKATAGFALGVSMNRSGLSVMSRSLMTSFFALATPLGVAIGVAVVTVMHASVSGYAEGLFDAIAAGTFLFMAVHFSQTQETVSLKARWISILFALVGFAVMAVIALYI